jgi:hypothetical protein
MHSSSVAFVGAGQEVTLGSTPRTEPRIPLLCDETSGRCKTATREILDHLTQEINFLDTDYSGGQAIV